MESFQISGLIRDNIIILATTMEKAINKYMTKSILLKNIISQ